MGRFNEIAFITEGSNPLTPFPYYCPSEEEASVISGVVISQKDLSVVSERGV